MPYPKQYGGPLSVEEIHAGMVAAKANAARLLADAELLLREERFASAAGLAILAIEEAGIILARMVADSDVS